jgi:hypothetical protein
LGWIIGVHGHIQLFLFSYVVIYCGRKGDRTENTEGAIKNGQSRETDNIGYTRRRQNKNKTEHNMCWTPPGADQDLWLGGAWVGEGSGDRLRSPAGPRQSPGRGPGGGAKPPGSSGVWEITDIYLNDNFEPTTPFLSDQKNLTLSLNFDWSITIF